MSLLPVVGTPSTVPQQLIDQRMVTIVPSAGGYSHWLEDGWLKQLDAVVAETLTSHRIPNDRVLVGGITILFGSRPPTWARW